MIYMTVAMHCEAKPFISYLGLKKDNKCSRFQVFKNNKVALIISGTGLVSSAVATTYLLTEYKAKASDLYINVGICGSSKKGIKKGRVVLCNKIINHNSKDSFYPDILFSHPFLEASLESFSKVVNREPDFKINGDLVDMEGAGAYRAASYFIPPHKICLIKIVSDFLEGENITSDKVYKLVEANVKNIIKWACEVQKSLCNLHKPILEEEKEYIEKIDEGLKLSFTMQHELDKLAKHYKISMGNLLEVIKPFLEVKCKSKNEGKIYFGKLKKQLMEC